MLFRTRSYIYHVDMSGLVIGSLWVFLGFFLGESF